jgi:hypothetical protein
VIGTGFRASIFPCNCLSAALSAPSLSRPFQQDENAALVPGWPGLNLGGLRLRWSRAATHLPPDPGAPGRPTRADEGRHRGSPAEQWSFGVGHAGLDRLLVVHLSLVEPEQRASFAAAVRLEPTYAVVLVAGGLPMPRLGLELRGPGIWADHNVEEPLERWSLGLEAFGVGVEVTDDEDLEVLLATSGSPDLRGDRAPLGWDLEWTTVAAAEPDGDGGYRVECRVEGEVLTAEGALVIDSPGERAHRW